MIFCILKGISPFKMHKIRFIPETLKIFLDFTSKFKEGRVYFFLFVAFFIWPNYEAKYNHGLLLFSPVFK